MTFYPYNGEPLTKTEMMREIVKVWREDREEARRLVYEYGISWFELAEWQLERERND